ncbi:unnamed protein product [Rotaria sp. Silwood1]|nr:unnamed protein product [Rotaria sp. Silwood1]CAF1635503.1 unnamed protein product [Rotaria sp. Silwood1]CAF3830458.1 unnamed protein product [Rotaria sp. Silwood1]
MCNGFIRKNKWAIPGLDLPGFPVKVSDYLSCLAICENTQECIAFDYILSMKNCHPKIGMGAGGYPNNDIVTGYNPQLDILSGPTRGGDGGGPFTDLDAINTSCISIPKSINVRCGSSVDSIQITYQTADAISSPAPKRGGDGGVYYSFELGPDERIVKVTGSTGYLVDGLQFTTNKGKTSPYCGGTGASNFTEQYPGYVLWYISGRYGSLVDQIQFHWVREPTKQCIR